MHHKIGRIAGYVSIAIWPAYVLATAGNLAMPRDNRLFPSEVLTFLAVAGLMSGMAWIAHAAVNLSTEEREAIYRQGVKDGANMAAGNHTDGLPLATILNHQAQRVNGNSRTSTHT